MVDNMALRGPEYLTIYSLGLDARSCRDDHRIAFLLLPLLQLFAAFFLLFTFDEMSEISF
jgi:hypothetical protein